MLFLHLMMVLLSFARGCLFLLAAGYVSSFAILLMLRGHVGDLSMSWMPHMWSHGFRLQTGVVVQAHARDPQMIAGVVVIPSLQHHNKSCHVFTFNSLKAPLRVQLQSSKKIINLQTSDIMFANELPMRMHFDRADHAVRFLKALHPDVTFHKNTHPDSRAHPHALQRVMTSGDDNIPAAAAARAEVHMWTAQTGSRILLLHRSWSVYQKILQLLKPPAHSTCDETVFLDRQKILVVDADALVSFVAPIEFMQNAALGVVMCLVSQFLAGETVRAFQLLQES
jgi:hypothetical protein